MIETTKNLKQTDDPSTDLEQTVEDSDALEQQDHKPVAVEQGGYEKSVEPTRYGDWEIGGRCVDF